MIDKIAGLYPIAHYRRMLGQCDHQWQKDAIWAFIGLHAAIVLFLIYALVKIMVAL